MKRSIITVMIIALITVFSCENMPFLFDVDCDPAVCTLNEPDSADLIVSLTINGENPYVPLIFYRGKIEDNIIEWIDTSFSETLYLYSPVNEYYSIRAFYKSGTQAIIASDGDKLKTVRISDVCEYDCWIIRGGILDVRLKDD
ncbi:MAG: hypothetical protein IH594_03420 [Bacteroidales bacterium]|nr:hypothetical protein [Bacteroidales bacterium]